jgi:hypothetical protein
MLDATTAYWNWVSAFYNNTLLIKSVQSNKERYEVSPSRFIPLLIAAVKELSQRIESKKDCRCSFNCAEKCNVNDSS